MINGASCNYVLSHNHGGVEGAEGLAHNANLLGSDIVDVHEDALLELDTAFLDGVPNFLFSELLIGLGGHIAVLLIYYKL
jgi:hypothetical protein